MRLHRKTLENTAPRNDVILDFIACSFKLNLMVAFELVKVY